ncbi:hypothetical protein [Sphingomonas lenta]|uniref:TonB C-terminal domain-containing protein n=1 Tax=Sphingomonas lenta TaxID=1141887 RepID=A0A2A2SJU4_9SPHN|nr:hypothetical protein [Sphingomonas lenta]PAX09502.1 hypothetical protein CKY28_01780 [Sphingomonas lenta]
MGVHWIMLLMQAAAPAQVMDLSRGPVSTTTVAVTVTLDPQGRVLSCRSGVGGAAACAGFKKGRVVSAPLRKNGKPVGGLMTVSTTSIVSER